MKEKLIEAKIKNGFLNIFNREINAVFKTKSWWIQIIIFTLIINGFLSVFLWVIPAVTSIDPELVPPITPDEVIGVFFQFSYLVLTISVIIMLQGYIIVEKQSGTAEWILSKPVSRSAFILAKLASKMLSIFVIIIIFQGFFSYMLFMMSPSVSIHPILYLFSFLVLFLHLLFYVFLTTMLGIIFKNRGAVLGICLGVYLGQKIFFGVFDTLLNKVIYVFPDRMEVISIFLLLKERMGLPYLAIILSTLIYIMVFLAVSLYWFNREEL